MRTQRLMDDEAAGEADVGAAIHALSDADLVRLRALARLRVRGLPGLDWTDLAHEAILRALDGTRRRPPGVPILAFLAGIMRSLHHDHRRRLVQERAWRERAWREQAWRERAESPALDPEETVAAAQDLRALCGLFADDATVLRIVEGLAQGRGAAEIRALHGLSETAYDSARKRLRRALLRFAPGEGAR